MRHSVGPALRRLEGLQWAAIVLSILVFGIALPGVAGAVIDQEHDAMPPAASATPTRSASRPQSPDAARPDGERRTVRYAPGQLIVKYRSEGAFAVTADVAKLINQRTTGAFRTATRDASASLDQLHATYHVKAAKPLFRQAGAGTTAALKQQQAARTRAIQRRFPQRTARAPKGAVLPDLTQVYVLHIPNETDVQAAAADFARDPHVEYAQPNYLVEVQWTPNDTYVDPEQDGTWSTGAWGQPYEDLWGLKAIHAEEAWEIAKGDGMIVAVVDTGLDYHHRDLSGPERDNVWLNTEDQNRNGHLDAGEDQNANGRLDCREDINCNGQADGLNRCPFFQDGDFNCVDDDANGFIDDLRGFDFYDSWDRNEDGDYLDKEDVKDPDPMDQHGHGTHVAGTIAAQGGNGLGIVGVAPEARIMPVRGLGIDGGYVSDLAKGIIYAADNGAGVINNSWGCRSRCPDDEVSRDAVRYAISQGVVVVFAAGNSGDDVMYYSPQNMRPQHIADSKPIVVAATTPADVPASFSNFGGLIDVAAPGGDSPWSPSDYSTLQIRNILSLKASGASDEFSGEGQLVVDQQYLRTAGTSMAAPHVAGVSALILSAHPAFTVEQVRQALRASADDVGSTELDLYAGAGRVNAARALQVDAVPIVRLTNPASGSMTWNDGGAIAIRGIAGGAEFAQAELAYRPATATGRWSRIGNLIQDPMTEEAELAQWSATALETGTYAVRLSVTTTRGVQFQDVAWVSIERDQHLEQLTSTGSVAEGPAIGGDRIAWVDGRPDEGGIRGWDIYLYDLARRDAGEQRLTRTRNAFQVALSDDRVAWVDNSQPYPADMAVYECSYHPEDRSCAAQLVDPGWPRTSPAKTPAVSGQRVLWVGALANWGLYLTELTNPDRETRRIAPSDEAELHYGAKPAIWGDRIAWIDNRSGTHQLYLYDLVYPERGAQRVTLDDAVLPRDGFFDPGSVAVHESRIAWKDIRHGFSQLYLYDLAHPEAGPQRLHADTRWVDRPALSGDFLVWSDRRNGNADVFLYDFRTRTEHQITARPTDQILPAISGDRVVWYEPKNDSHEGDLYTTIVKYPLVLRIQKPRDGAIIRGRRAVNINTAADVTRIKLAYQHQGSDLRWRKLGEPLTPQRPGRFRTRWDTRLVPNGAYKLRAIGFDATGKRLGKAVVTVTVQNLPSQSPTALTGSLDDTPD